jgi:hypothetical protein
LVSKIAFLYLAYIAWGCLALLPLVKLQEVGQGFYRFFGFTCVTLQTLAIGLAILMGPAFDPSYHLAAWVLGGSLFFTLCFTIALKVRVKWFLWGCFAAAVLSGLAAIAYFPWAGQAGQAILCLHAVSSALLLGSVTLAMMLGHWYLVTPKLSIEPLKRYSASYILLTLWMALQIVLGYFFTRSQGVGEGLPPWFQEQMIFILFRSVWGLLAPLGMAYWIWETVKMKSTQSATGILYAAMVCTLLGEGMGLYLTLQTGVPL